MKKLYKIFDKFEDKVRSILSHHPIPYAFIGGIAIVLFWRGVWHLADDYGLTSWGSIIIGSLIMLSTGLFVSFFIGDRIILSGLKREKKVAERTETELELEKNILDSVDIRLAKVEEDLSEIKQLLKK